MREWSWCVVFTRTWQAFHAGPAQEAEAEFDAVPRSASSVPGDDHPVTGRSGQAASA